MGGRAATQEFFRLFMIPGMNHCSMGSGAYTIDYLSYLEGWVEGNKPPNQMIGAHVTDDYLLSMPLPSEILSEMPSDATSSTRAAWAAFYFLRFPLDPTIPVEFTRPIYPYPFYARYTGGDPNAAASFRPAGATAAP